MSRPDTYYYLLPVIAVTVFISFLRLDSVTLFDYDEGVFAEAAKEMAETGDWITPAYNGESRFDKPVFFYWTMALSYKLFGVNEFGARFPSALSAFLLILAVFFFVRHFRGDQTAFYASLSLILSVYFSAYSHAAVTDMVLTLLITLSLFSFFLSLERGRWFTYGFYAFSSLAFLTKGLIGIIFPFGIAAIYTMLAGGFKDFRKIFSLKGIVIFLLIAGPWYALQTAINGSEFINQFFIKHHFKRYTDVISGHEGPFYYYIPVLIVGLMPWTAFLPAGIRNAFKERDHLGLFALTWFAFIFLFFSFSVTKLPNYVAAAVPAAGILISSGVSMKDRLNRSSNIFIAAVSALTGIVFLISKKYLAQYGVQDTAWTLIPALLMFLMAFLIVFSVITKKIHYVYMSVIMIAFLSFLSIRAVPVINSYLQGTLYKYSLLAKNRLQRDERIIVYGINNPSILFYSGHKIIDAGTRDELIALTKNKKNLLAIAKAGEVGAFRELGFSLLEEDGRYAILERK